MDFLRTELETAFAFAALAECRRKSGQCNAANGAIADAENSFDELVRFLYNPKSATYVTALERSAFKEEIRRLRKKLDSVAGIH